MGDTRMLMFLFVFNVTNFCWVVAASLVADETNAGVRVFVAEITSMWHVWPQV